MIVDLVRNYLSGGNKQLNTEAMEVAVARFKKSLEGQFSSERGPRDTSVLKLYPSEAGKCERLIQYKAMGIPGEPMMADVQFKLAMGDLIETALLYVISSVPGLGVIENNRIRDIVIAGRPWRGATDGIHIDGAKRRNVEVKSASGIGFKMTVQKGVDNTFGYLSQAAVYVRQLLRDKVVTEPETLFVYIDRDSMKLWETIVPHDDSLATEADKKFLRVIDAVERKKLLPRPYELKDGGVLGLVCSYCSHKHTCWVEPKQVVTYEAGLPVYREKPTKAVKMTMTSRGKPEWRVE